MSLCSAKIFKRQDAGLLVRPLRLPAIRGEGGRRAIPASITPTMIAGGANRSKADDGTSPGHGSGERDAAAEPAKAVDVSDKISAPYADEADAERERFIKEVERSIYENAFQIGQAEGLTKGREEAHASIAEQAQRFEQGIATLMRTASSLEQKYAHDIGELVTAAAKKIICREVSADPSVVVDIIKQAIRSLADRSTVRIKLSQDDFRRQQELKRKIVGEMDEIQKLSFVEDAALNTGDVVIDSEGEQVDATIDSQLQRIRASLSEQVGKSGAT